MYKVTVHFDDNDHINTYAFICNKDKYEACRKAIYNGMTNGTPLTLDDAIINLKYVKMATFVELERTNELDKEV